MRVAQENHRKELVSLRTDYRTEEKTLQDLVLDKSRVMAELDSSWAEISAYNRAVRPTVSDKAVRSNRNTQLKAGAKRDTYRFMKEDEYETYKLRGSTLDMDDTIIAMTFDSLVRQAEKDQTKLE